MSLGWQTESALLPSNSKPINVDGKSLVGLKALLYDQQQQRANGQDSIRNARNVNSTRKEEKANKYVLNSSSAGKNQCLKNIDPAENEPNVLASLTAKSKLYDEMSRGKVKLQSDVVNFEEKIGIDIAQHRVRTDYVPPPRPPSMPNPAKKTENATEADFHGPLVSNTSNSDSQNNTQPEWNWSRTYGPADTDISGNRTDSHDHDNSEYRNQKRGEAELKKAVEGRIQTETMSNASTTTAKSSESGEYRVSEAARVKSQWEKTLNSSARDFLEQVHDDTTIRRAAVSLQTNNVGGAEGTTQKRSLREEKLDLIRQKRSKLA